MTTVQMRAKVDADGNISLTVPYGKADAGREVMVTVSPAESSRMDLTPEDWLKAITATAGSIDDPTFVRPEQPVKRREFSRVDGLKIEDWE